MAAEYPQCSRPCTKERTSTTRCIHTIFSIHFEAGENAYFLQIWILVSCRMPLGIEYGPLLETLFLNLIPFSSLLSAL